MSVSKIHSTPHEGVICRCCLIASRLDGGVLLALGLMVSVSHAQELAKWSPLPAEWKGATVADGTSTMTADKWSYLVAPDEHGHVELSATVTIAEPAKQFRFFGEGRRKRGRSYLIGSTLLSGNQRAASTFSRSRPFQLLSADRTIQGHRAQPIPRTPKPGT